MRAECLEICHSRSFPLLSWGGRYLLPHSAFKSLEMAVSSKYWIRLIRSRLHFLETTFLYLQIPVFAQAPSRGLQFNYSLFPRSISLPKCWNTCKIIVNESNEGSSSTFPNFATVISKTKSQKEPVKWQKNPVKDGLFSLSLPIAM